MGVTIEDAERAQSAERAMLRRERPDLPRIAAWLRIVPRVVSPDASAWRDRAFGYTRVRTGLANIAFNFKRFFYWETKPAMTWTAAKAHSNPHQTGSKQAIQASVYGQTLMFGAPASEDCRMESAIFKWPTMMEHLRV